MPVGYFMRATGEFGLVWPERSVSASLRWQSRSDVRGVTPASAPAGEMWVSRVVAPSAGSTGRHSDV